MPSLALACRLIAVSLASRRPFSPASLFSSGERGVWYDPSDFSTMFQDAAGTTPVTAVEQPVGLILDKSKGLTLGSELIFNGSFDSLDGWDINADSNLSISGGQAIFATTPAYRAFRQLNRVIPGRTYKLTIDVASISAGSIYVPGILNSVITTAGVKSFILTATTVNIALMSANLGATAVVNSISVRELPGNHATQSTTTSRPTLQQDTSGKYYLSFDGVDDSLSTGSIDFTGTDKMTVLAGVRKLGSCTGVVVELSANTNAYNGAFGLYGPDIGNDFTFATRGTLGANNVVGGYPAPITAIITGVGDIAAPANAIRVNGSQKAKLTTAQGTGNYGNYPFYIGRRGGTTFPFNGRLYGLIVRGAATDATQLEQTEQWINSKMGGIY